MDVGSFFGNDFSFFDEIDQLLVGQGREAVQAFFIGVFGSNGHKCAAVGIVHAFFPGGGGIGRGDVNADLGGVFFQILNLGPGGKREQNGTNKQQIKQLLQYRSPSFNQRFRYD